MTVEWQPITHLDRLPAVAEVVADEHMPAHAVAHPMLRTKANHAEQRAVIERRQGLPMLTRIESAQHQPLLADQHAATIGATVHAVEVRAVDLQRQSAPSQAGVVGLVEFAEAAECQHLIAVGRPDTQQRLALLGLELNLLPAGTGGL